MLHSLLYKFYDDNLTQLTLSVNDADNPIQSNIHQISDPCKNSNLYVLCDVLTYLKE